MFGGWVKMCEVYMCTSLKLLLLKIIASMKKGYVDVWGMSKNVQGLYVYFFKVVKMSKVYKRKNVSNFPLSHYLGEHLFKYSLPPPPGSQTLRHQPGNFCREFTSAYSQQPESNREPLVSERELLRTKLHALNTCTNVQNGCMYKVQIDNTCTNGK